MQPTAALPQPMIMGPQPQPMMGPLPQPMMGLLQPMMGQPMMGPQPTTGLGRAMTRPLLAADPPRLTAKAAAARPAGPPAAAFVADDWWGSTRAEREGAAQQLGMSRRRFECEVLGWGRRPK